METYPRSNTPYQSQTIARCEIFVTSVTHWALWTTDRFHSRQMSLRAISRWAGDTARTQVEAVSRTRSRTTGPTVLPKLTQFTTEFLTCRGPVVSDVVADFRHMALDFQFVLLEPRHVQLLSRGTALELARDVLIVVTDNSKPSQNPAKSDPSGKETYLVIMPVVLTPSVL